MKEMGISVILFVLGIIVSIYGYINHLNAESIIVKCDSCANWGVPWECYESFDCANVYDLQSTSWIFVLIGLIICLFGAVFLSKYWYLKEIERLKIELSGEDE